MHNQLWGIANQLILPARRERILSRVPSSTGSIAELSPVRRNTLFPSFHAENDDHGTKFEAPVANVDLMPSVSKDTVPDLALAALAIFAKRAFQRNHENQIKKTAMANIPAIGPQRAS